MTPSPSTLLLESTIDTVLPTIPSPPTPRFNLAPAEPVSRTEIGKEWTTGFVTSALRGKTGCPNLWIRMLNFSGAVTPSVSDSEPDDEDEAIEPSLHDNVETVAPACLFERCNLSPKKVLECDKEG